MVFSHRFLSAIASIYIPNASERGKLPRCCLRFTRFRERAHSRNSIHPVCSLNRQTMACFTSRLTAGFRPKNLQAAPRHSPVSACLHPQTNRYTILCELQIFDGVPLNTFDDLATCRMGAPWVAHGILVVRHGCQGCPLGVPWGLGGSPWVAHGYPMGAPWILHR